MTAVPSAEPEQPQPNRSWNRWYVAPIVWAGFALAGGLIAWRSLAARPDCPDGYVRLIDLMPAMPIVFAILGFVAVLVLFLTRGWVRATAGVIGLVITGCCLVVAVFMASGSAAGADCWTF